MQEKRKGFGIGGFVIVVFGERERGLEGEAVAEVAGGNGPVGLGTPIFCLHRHRLAEEEKEDEWSGMERDFYTQPILTPSLAEKSSHLQNTHDLFVVCCFLVFFVADFSIKFVIFVRRISLL